MPNCAGRQGKGLPALNLQQTWPRRRMATRASAPAQSALAKGETSRDNRKVMAPDPAKPPRLNIAWNPNRGRLLDFDGMNVHGHIDGAQRGAEDQQHRGEQEWIEDE